MKATLGFVLAGVLCLLAGVASAERGWFRSAHLFGGHEAGGKPALSHLVTLDRKEA